MQFFFNYLSQHLTHNTWEGDSWVYIFKQWGQIWVEQIFLGSVDKWTKLNLEQMQWRLYILSPQVYLHTFRILQTAEKWNWKSSGNGKGRSYGFLTEKETRSLKFFGCDYHQLERPLDSWASLGCVWTPWSRQKNNNFGQIFKLLEQPPNWNYYICLDEFTNRAASHSL